MRDRASLLTVAHRGASAYRPEHTFEAYDLAIALGSDVLELDLRASADGEPVVLHDRSLWRTAMDPRSVNTVSLDGLRELDPVIRPLTLREVFDRYGSQTRYLLDVKEPRGALIDRVIDVALEAGLRGRTQLQCFSRAGLVRAHRRTPWLSLAQLYQPMVPRRAMLRDLRRMASVVDTIGPEAASVDDELVAAACSPTPRTIHRRSGV